jgi:hypothetical protein
MSIEEHLVENSICELERNKDYKKFMASELLIEQSKQTKIPMSFMWIMAQYVVYTYKESIESDMIKAYGYDIKEVEE